jgi:hypothetical protein
VVNLRKTVQSKFTMAGESLEDYLTRVGASEDDVAAFLQDVEIGTDFEEFLRNRRANHSVINQTSITLTVPSAQTLANSNHAKSLHEFLNCDVNGYTIRQLMDPYIPLVHSIVGCLYNAHESTKDARTASEIAAAYAKLHQWGVHSTKELEEKLATLLKILKWMRARVESDDMTREKRRRRDDDDDDEEKKDRSYHPSQTRAARKSSNSKGRARHRRVTAAGTVQS